MVRKKTTSLSPAHQKKVLSRFENQLFPRIGDVPISKLEPSDILAAVRYAEERGLVETAHRLAQLVGQVCRYARLCGYVKYDVASGLVEALPPVQRRHIWSRPGVKKNCFGFSGSAANIYSASACGGSALMGVYALPVLNTKDFFRFHHILPLPRYRERRISSNSTVNVEEPYFRSQFA
jgi:hypothetical protein